MTHGSLFSGIGGFDLAAQWMGWTNVFHCEVVESKRKFLECKFKNSISHADITTTDFTFYRGAIDVLSGGFPCQDASIANQWGEGQQGLQGERTGLFRHMVRAIEEIRPRYVVAENVANFLAVNGGSDIRATLSELARMGYNAEWRVCRASEVGAPHHRARLYLVAYSDRIRLQSNQSFYADVHAEIAPFTWFAAGTSVQISTGGRWKCEPPILCVDDGLPTRLVADQLHGYGNAIVPDIAFRIFKSIEYLENNCFCQYGFDTCLNKTMCDTCDDGSNYENL